MSHRGKRLRQVPGPFVVAPPAGARVRTRLPVNSTDEVVLQALGAHLGHLASGDLARRVAEGPLDAKGKAQSRQARKQALTGVSSSRWAGAITRTSEDAYGLAKRDLQAERASLRARADKTASRVALGPGEAKGRAVGYASASERWQEQRRAITQQTGARDQAQAGGDHRTGLFRPREAVAIRPQCRPEVPGTRWPKTVRGRPVRRAHSCSLSRAHSCSLSRNGSTLMLVEISTRN